MDFILLLSEIEIELGNRLVVVVFKPPCAQPM